MNTIDSLLLVTLLILITCYIVLYKRTRSISRQKVWFFRLTIIINVLLLIIGFADPTLIKTPIGYKGFFYIYTNESQFGKQRCYTIKCERYYEIDSVGGALTKFDEDYGVVLSSRLLYTTNDGKQSLIPILSTDNVFNLSKNDEIVAIDLGVRNIGQYFRREGNDIVPDTVKCTFWELLVCNRNEINQYLAQDRSDKIINVYKRLNGKK